MKPITYSLQFRGQARSLRSNLVRLTLTAPSSALVTTVGALGVHGIFSDVSGGEAILHSELSWKRQPSPTAARSSSAAATRCAFAASPDASHDCADPHLRHGAVICQVEGGEGQFAGCEGLITSNFFLSDTGEVTQNHFGLIFVQEQVSDMSWLNQKGEQP